MVSVVEGKERESSGDGRGEGREGDSCTTYLLKKERHFFFGF